MAIVDSGDWRSLPITGKSSEETRCCLHGRCAHIFASEKRAIFKGDSLTASFLLGFRATAEQSATNFSKAYRTENSIKSSICSGNKHCHTATVKDYIKVLC